MELTRRDAAAALAAIGATGGIALGVTHSRRGRTPDDRDELVQSTMAAIATVVYPSEVDGVTAFVEAFLAGRLDDGSHATELRATVDELNRLARAWHGGDVPGLPPATREQLLREVGADTADEDPSGTTAERVRYYVVNELLVALYASPTGAELVGLENPPGHPGGTTSYTQPAP